MNEGYLVYSELNQLLLNLQITIWENENKIFKTSEGFNVIDTKIFKDNKDLLNININADNQISINN